ncbi:LysE family transporter [Fulvivirgaceae bacterium PWU4]|uniref:LysE family transporter n=1 Tax=Chryseosolibacter histidini TaxID=2782349 RepID=A0AAP2DPB6_9BACT|nr:LysE family transporter [Chryseosolibacter histidini]MBT1700038.1 LysE family transporter [Chryseosolibacter histidini]
MEALLTLSIAFLFSFIGTIPPGTMNLTIIGLGLEHRISTAWRFALAAALIEYPYAWLAVEFENLITSSPMITANFRIITGVVMTVLGVISLRSSQKPSPFAKRFQESGFRRGILLALLNPLALPFWVAMTAYLKSQRWIDLDTNMEVHFYLLGVSLGSLSLLIILAYLARRVVRQFQGNTFLKKIPGITLLVLGAYALIQYFFF